MVDIRLCLVLDGRLYASPECLIECYKLYLTTFRVFKVMLIYCPNLKSDLKVTLIKSSVILHI